MTHLLHPNREKHILHDVSPSSAGWTYLRYRVVRLSVGEVYEHETGNTEIALVPLSGRAQIEAADQTFDVARTDVFSELAPVLYAPPRTAIRVHARTAFEFAIGGAPAEGIYPLRLIQPAEIRREIRGGGAATRQVCHTLSHPLPAERLILFEVYVPGGHWSGWPPHCHDGYAASAYLEETYYFRMDPATGSAMHRNYRIDTDFDEVYTVNDSDLVLVTQGFHSTAAAPNCTLYFLNFLAGELIGDARATPPYDDPAFAYIKDDWAAHSRPLPIIPLLDE